MSASVLIRQDHTDVPYKMSFYFHPEKDKWVLSFNCVRPGIYKKEEYPYNTFEEVRRHFINNCKYYYVNIPENLPETEEEFFGVPIGTIFPTSHQPKKKSFNYPEAIHGKY